MVGEGFNNELEMINSGFKISELCLLTKRKNCVVEQHYADSNEHSTALSDPLLSAAAFVS
jgi:hypothetical protein